ncbi:MAG: hypothetical protein JWQ57_3858 [Mucilaginibacter sp.]|nr:hypothetical protein [Mucilaginibacter sp.]
MNWEQLKENVYYTDGSLRDIVIKNTSKSDWCLWANFVNGHYKIKFNTDGISENKINIEKAIEAMNGVENTLWTSIVYIGDITLKTHFFIEKEIEHDIDPKEFKTIDDHHKLIKYMSDISVLLNKEVNLTDENMHDNSLINANGKNITINF